MWFPSSLPRKPRPRRNPTHAPRAPRRYRPSLESLEDRLPPGDTVGGLLAGSWLGAAPPARVPPGQPHAVNTGGATAASLLVEARAAERPSHSDREVAPPGGQRAPAAFPVAEDDRAAERDAGPLAELFRPTPSPLPSRSLGANFTILGQGPPSGLTLAPHGRAQDGRLSQAPAPATAVRPSPDEADLAVLAGRVTVAAAKAATPTPAAEPHPQDAPTVFVSAASAAQPGKAEAVHARFDLESLRAGPFPSNRFTVADGSQLTGLRIALPLPDPVTHPSDYDDVQVLNTLDGFNLQPRLSIPFDGRIDVNTVSSHSVFLVRLGDAVPGGDSTLQKVGINQVVWDTATTTLHVESDELLDQHTRYTLVVTSGVRDVSGAPVQASAAFRQFLQEPVGDPGLRAYQRQLWGALTVLEEHGLATSEVVSASVFTTQSATAILEKIRDQIHAATPAPANFNLGPNGERTVFDFNQVNGITHNRQTRTDMPLSPVPVEIGLLNVIPGAVGQIAFGKYVSPDYEVHPGEYIPPVGTLTGTPAVQGINEIYFNLVLPSGPEPPGGWPVAIDGHGGNRSKELDMPLFATLAAQGIAALYINAVGHGFGPLGTLTVNGTAGEAVTFPAGGRGIDQNGDHIIGSNEGFFASAPRTIIRNRDGMIGTVGDLMQLVRVIQVGMDVDGDGSPDLDPSRIYYFGGSRGGIYGTDFLAVEPDVRTGVLTVAGGADEEGRRLSAGGRSGLAQLLAARMPSLINVPGVTHLDGVAITGTGPYFNENAPLRDGVPLAVRLTDGTSHEIRSPVINSVAGAMDIQQVFENYERVSQSGNPVAYAAHLRKAPLAGVPAKSVIYQFAKGDQTVPNPTTTAILRAGDLADRATFYRHDLAHAEIPGLPSNPHGFMALFTTFGAIALEAQRQIATFFASDGKEIIHPEPARFFEVDLTGRLPEDLGYIP